MLHHIFAVVAVLSFSLFHVILCFSFLLSLRSRYNRVRAIESVFIDLYTDFSLSPSSSIFTGWFLCLVPTYPYRLHRYACSICVDISIQLNSLYPSFSIGWSDQVPSIVFNRSLKRSTGIFIAIQ